MKKKLIAGVTGVALAAGMGLGVAQLAQADTGSPTPAPSPGASAPANGGKPMNRMGGQGEQRGMGSAISGHSPSHVAELATKVGLPQETVPDALKAVREETRAARPSTGFTDPDDRDAAREQRRSAIVDALAEELGIDRDTLSTAMSELRAENQASREGNRAARLDEAVNSGTLTTEEANVIQKARDSGVLAGRGHGGGHSRR